MQKQKQDRRLAIRTMVAVAVFCAVAYVCQFVFRIHVAFLTFDAKDAVMAIGAMLFGPAWGLVMSLLVAFLEGISNSDSGFIGFLMNFLSSAAFVCVSAWIYRYKRTMTGAILGLCAGVLSMTAIMIPLNLLMTPLYVHGATVASVAAMIPTLLLPFNLSKALFNAGLVLVLYKPISIALKKAHVLRGDIGTFRFDKRSLLVLLLGGIVIALCVTAFLAFLGGSIGYGIPADILDKAS